ncbi:GNAT family N-acetyltransferase [Sphingomonas sp. PB4P5]|uniref:GNAT family N-acetyltransferase n=1 Tax=Parasphingomonas puruogangriensis TaxID=3096155 RepID=UPI002FC77E8F
MAPPAHPLDRPIWHSLSGPHAPLALGDGTARRYRPDIHFFAATPDDGPDSLVALARLRPAGGTLGLLQAEASDPPPGTRIRSRATINQMVLTDLTTTGATSAFDELGDRDAPDMFALATLTAPGPFFAETHRLGAFIGVRHERELIAMAGERTKPPGFTEVSAVCTHPAHRGQGLARALMQIVIARILARGDAAFLHVYATNTGAITLYEALGFRFRREMLYTILEDA